MEVKELFEEAKKASENSYSPYSEFPVGACCLFESGKTYLGSNIENMSYGLTLCAERAAIANAISNGEKSGLVAIAVYSPKQKLCMPCGACLQWISEFRAEECDTKIILEDRDGDTIEYKISDFLPYCFKIMK